PQDHITLEMAPLEIRHRSVRPISAKHAQASRFLQQSPHNLKLKVVAEGVESAEQLAFLRRNRCDIGQGYLFDRPIPSDLLNTSLLRYPCRTLH
ncbi:EAL domain-containing protein, partial [Pseudomonas aeruginosa]|uniref:EAL domain-containing protein n=1 Tax=Pseudomonas aeruginosa TaxID=287 RepID=UPI003EC00DEE